MLREFVVQPYCKHVYFFFHVLAIKEVYTFTWPLSLTNVIKPRIRYRTIFPAYTQRQSTHQCCQYFDLYENAVKWTYSTLMASIVRTKGIRIFRVTILILIRPDQTMWVYM